jgi:hypothetical protein
MAHKPNNNNMTTKKGIVANDKPTSPQFDIAKQIMELMTYLKKVHQSVEALKKGQTVQNQLLLKLSNKVKNHRQVKNSFTADEIVGYFFLMHIINLLRKYCTMQQLQDGDYKKSFTDEEYEDMAASALEMQQPAESELEIQKIDAASTLVGFV